MFLRRALADIVAQTYSNLTVVVVNDAGEIGPVDEIVQELSGEQQRLVTVVHNERSKGREAAMNAGVLACDSAFIAIHDDDDSWAPSFLERTTAHLKHSPDLAVATRTELVYERFDGESIALDRRKILAADKSAISLSELIHHNYAPPISVLYRRSLHDTVGLYDETLPVLADWDFLLRVAANGEIGFIDGEPLAFWHQREGLLGDAGNSVVTDADAHSRYETIIRDRYLRADIARNGGMGTLLFEAALIDETSRRDDARTAHLSRGLDLAAASTDELRRELVRLNQNLIGQSNRMVAQSGALADQIAALERLVFSQTPRARFKAYGEITARLLKRFRH
ncbi:MAG: glycosyltransferase [Actinomycetota bacterium]|nr:glycosyltransferase [Actinomycetota bacterium]